MISLTEALARIAAAVRPLPCTIERVPLLRSTGRVLAKPASADRAQPPFDRSTRDGYAVRSADFTSDMTLTDSPTLTCIGEVAAGDQPGVVASQGTCVAIMTGAAVPTGFDAVVMVEDTQRNGDKVIFNARPRRGENIVPRGSEATEGDLVLASNTRIEARALGVLASVGCDPVAVYSQPKVAIVSTGNELVAIRATPSATQIRNSNATVLAALVASQGCAAQIYGPAPDEPEKLQTLLQQARDESDCLIVTGGVSKGKYDHVKAALEKLGAKQAFAGVAIRPGKPVVFGLFEDKTEHVSVAAVTPSTPPSTRGAKPYFALPGNPVSAHVTFNLLVAPALATLCRSRTTPEPRLFGTLQEAYRRPTERLHLFVPAAWVRGEGPSQLRPLRSSGSADLVSLATADVLLSIPPGRGDLAPGCSVAYLPLR